MRQFIVNLGLLQTVLLITLFSLLMSLLVTTLVTYALPFDMDLQVLYSIATIVPLIVAPVVSTIIVKSFLQLHYLEKQIHNYAYEDALSGLLNRRAWFDRAETYYALAKRQQSPFAILMLDFDYFKAINDQYGHAAGDKVIMTFGEICRTMTRKSDICSRFGGEEFALLLPDTTPEHARQFAERLHEKIRKTRIPYEGKTIQFTISIGIDFFDPVNKRKVELMLSRADKALYHAKQNGKNQTVCSEEVLDS